MPWQSTGRGCDCVAIYVKALALSHRAGRDISQQFTDSTHSHILCHSCSIMARATLALAVLAMLCKSLMNCAWHMSSSLHQVDKALLPDVACRRCQRFRAELRGGHGQVVSAPSSVQATSSMT